MRTAVLPALLLAGLLSAAEQPNVVVIVADDLGYQDIACFGGSIPTPNIDSLARDGARLTQWYATASICTPTRYSLLTGRHPLRSGLTTPLRINSKEHIPADEVTLAMRLRGAGYATNMIGKWHLGHQDPAFAPQQFGFDHFYGHLGGLVNYVTHTIAGERVDWQRDGTQVDETGYTTDLMASEAVKVVQGATKPYFLYLAFNAPHYSRDPKTGNAILQAKPEDEARFPADDKRRTYKAMVKSLDDSIGRVLGAIEATGAAKSTIVVFTSDNGGDERYGGCNLPLRGGKHTNYEGGIRVCGIWRWPGVAKPGSTVSGVCSVLDIVPTLCAALQVDAGKLCEGQNIAPLLAGGAAPARDLFWSDGKHWAVRSGDLKLISGGGNTELFDLVADPVEMSNRAGERQPEVARLRTTYERLAKTP